jgi:hypothetical protein
MPIKTRMHHPKFPKFFMRIPSDSLNWHDGCSCIDGATKRGFPRQQPADPGTMPGHPASILHKGLTLSSLNSANDLCPLVKEEYEECYFMKMTSSDIQNTVLFCAGNYATCVIFRRRSSARQNV